MDNEIPKTYFDLIVILIPVISSAAFLYVGKWWESKSNKEANLFALDRDRITRKRDKTLEIYDNLVTDIQVYMDAQIDVLVQAEILQNLITLEKSNSDEGSFKGLNLNLNKAYDEFEKRRDRILRIKVQLTLIGLKELRKDIDQFVAAFQKSHSEYSNDIESYDLKPSINLCRVKRLHILEVVTNRFDEFWEETE